MESSTLLSIITNIVTILGFPLLICSILLLVRQMRIQAYQAIYDSISGIDQFFVENPDLREYLYGDKALPEDPKDRERVIAAADMLITFFEHVLAQKKGFSPKVWNGFREYMCDAYNSSPALQYFLEQKGYWYSDELKLVLTKNVQALKEGNN